MSCERYREFVSAASDGELTPDERTELDAHLDVCAGCRAFAADLESLHEIVQSAEPLRLSQVRQREIMRRTVEAGSSGATSQRLFSNLRRPSRVLAWAASLAFLVVIGNEVLKSRRGDTETAGDLAGRSLPEQTVVRIALSEDDIVGESSTLKIRLSDQDVVKSTTMVLSEGGV